MSTKSNGAVVSDTTTPHKDLKPDKGKLKSFDFEHFSGEKLIDDADVDAEAEAESFSGLSDFEFYRVTLEKELPPHEHLLKWGPATVAKAGNITALSGETKAGKTAAKDILIATALGCSQYPDISVAANPSNYAIISIDCEQDEDDQQHSLSVISKRTGLARLPAHLVALNFRKMELAQYKENTRKLFEACVNEFGGIHLCFIDGGTDYLINGANDERESVELLDYFVKLAIEFNCAIFIVVHLNEGASKTGNDTMRGHFGKYVSRKAYGQLNVTKQNDISTVEVLRGRKSGADTPVISYRYCREHGYHIPVDGQQVQDERQDAKDRLKKEQAKSSVKGVMSATETCRYTDLVSRLMKKYTIEDSASKKRIRSYEAWGLIIKGDDGLYRRNNEELV